MIPILRAWASPTPERQPAQPAMANPRSSRNSVSGWRRPSTWWWPQFSAKPNQRRERRHPCRPAQLCLPHFVLRTLSRPHPLFPPHLLHTSSYRERRPVTVFFMLHHSLHHHLPKNTTALPFNFPARMPALPVGTGAPQGKESRRARQGQGSEVGSKTSRRGRLGTGQGRGNALSRPRRSRRLPKGKKLCPMD